MSGSWVHFGNRTCPSFQMKFPVRFFNPNPVSASIEIRSTTLLSNRRKIRMVVISVMAASVAQNVPQNAAVITYALGLMIWTFGSINALRADLRTKD